MVYRSLGILFLFGIVAVTAAGQQPGASLLRVLERFGNREQIDRKSVV